MKPFFRSFYAKISAIFLAMLLLLGSIQAYITYRSSMRLVMEADQKLNLSLAENMAAELQPEVARNFSPDSIKQSIHYMMVMNPKVEIYLLDGQGGILAFFASPTKKVKSRSIDTAPVDRFLENGGEELILGDDPRFPDEQKPFSAAKIEIESRPGYLYIILGGEQYQTNLDMLKNSYIFSTSLLAFTIAIISTGAIGLIIFAFLTRRIRTMKNVVHDFKRGETDRRIEITSDDEIGSLARSFNEMADTIVENMEKLKQNDAMRRQLVANVSHDLRSPLASIRGYLETILIREDKIPAEQRKNYLETIFKNTLHLSNLVHELFELSKLEAKNTELNLETFSIADLAQDIIIKLKPDAEKKDIDLDVQTDRSSVMIKGDIALLERAVTNLIQNAIEHTPRGGNIRLIMQEQGDSVRITVEDTGCGIDEEDLPHIFDRFYKGKNSQTGSGESTGLGLAITHKIIDLHHSSIEVESTKGRGTSFHFELETA